MWKEEPCADGDQRNGKQDSNKSIANDCFNRAGEGHIRDWLLASCALKFWPIQVLLIMDGLPSW
jgi:hypothetical protein